MNKDPRELAEIYARAAFDRCVQISTVNGKTHNYRIARVGVGDGVWVDTDGVLYVQRAGKFDPHYLISSLFSKLSDEDFNISLSIPDSEKPGELKKIKAHQFGKRNMLVGKDGVLFFCGEHERIGLFGQPKSSSNGLNAKLNSNLERRAYEIAKIGYDPSCLSIARDNIEKSSLPDVDKAQFNAKLDQIVQQYQ